MGDPNCANGFCDLSWMRSADIFIENEFCVFISSEDAAIRTRAGLFPGVLPGSGVIVPIVHRTSPFDLTPEEWSATRELLLVARRTLHGLLAPDGYTLGWNDQTRLHAHLHVVPRFDDEPMVDTGIRSGINVPENRRPDPHRPGTGRALLAT
jgi:diadenosine tetraphosphate (Ap4A) HIT family hydrolase